MINEGIFEFTLLISWKKKKDTRKDTRNVCKTPRTSLLSIFEADLWSKEYFEKKASEDPLNKCKHPYPRVGEKQELNL